MKYHRFLLVVCFLFLLSLNLFAVERISSTNFLIPHSSLTSNSGDGNTVSDNFAIIHGSVGGATDGNSSSSNFEIKSGYALAALYPSPVVTITVPSPSQSTTNTTITVTYSINPSAQDLNSIIKKFWVKLDDGIWEDNGFNLSFEFRNVAIGTHDVYVKVTTLNDFNVSEKTVQTIITAEGSDTVPPTSPGVGGGGPTNPTVTDTLLFEASWDSRDVLDADYFNRLQPYIDDSNFSVDSISALRQALHATKTLEAYERNTDGALTYYNELSIELTNTSDVDISDVDLLELFLSTGKVTRAEAVPDSPFTLIEDNAIAFSESTLAAGATVNYTYSVDADLVSGDEALFQEPLPYSASLIHTTPAEVVEVVDPEVIEIQKGNAVVVTESISGLAQGGTHAAGNLKVQYSVRFLENGLQTIKLISNNPDADLSGYTVSVSDSLFDGTTNEQGEVSFRVHNRGKYTFTLSKDSLTFKGAFEVFGVNISMQGTPEFGEVLTFTITDSEGNPLEDALVFIEINGRRVEEKELDKEDTLDYVVTEFGDLVIGVQVDDATATRTFHIEAKDAIQQVQQVLGGVGIFVGSSADFIFGAENLKDPLLILLLVLFSAMAALAMYAASSNLFAGDRLSTRLEYRNKLKRGLLALAFFILPFIVNRLYSPVEGILIAILELGIMAGLHFYLQRVQKTGLAAAYQK